jgi:hypothetical protein
MRLQYVNSPLIKPCCFQAIGEGARVHYHHSVEQVKQPKCAAVKAVRTRKNPAGPQNATYLCQQAVLQGLGRHVMKHRETYGGIKCRLRQWHGGRILVEHRYIVARHAPAQGISESLIDFYASKTLDPRSQEIRGHAGAGTNFQNTRADVETLKDPRKDIGFDALTPIIRTAEPTVRKIHRGKYLEPKTV